MPSRQSDYEFSGLYKCKIENDTIILPELFYKSLRVKKLFLLGIGSAGLYSDVRYICVIPDDEYFNVGNEILRDWHEGISGEDLVYFGGTASLNDNGSFTISDELLTFARITTPDLVITGQINKMHIWHEAQWEEATNPERIPRDIVEKMIEMIDKKIRDKHNENSGEGTSELDID